MELKDCVCSRGAELTVVQIEVSFSQVASALISQLDWMKGILLPSPRREEGRQAWWEALTVLPDKSGLMQHKVFPLLHR